MAIKKLAVCGCSFMTSSYLSYKAIRGSDWPEFPITDEEWKEIPKFIKKEMIKFNYIHNPSFLNLFCREKGFEEINLAIGGSSNLKIREQIDDIIKIKPDYVVIGATDWNRQDFLTSDKNTISYKYFLTELYNTDTKKLSDYYILQSGLVLLEKHDIPYVFIPGPMNGLNWESYQIIWPHNVSPPWYRAVEDRNVHNHVVLKDHIDLCKELIKITKNW